jgi:hypothetical protein
MGYSPDHQIGCPTTDTTRLGGTVFLQRPCRFYLRDQGFGQNRRFAPGAVGGGTLRRINPPAFGLLTSSPYIIGIEFGVPTPKTSLAVRSVLQTVAPLFHFAGSRELNHGRH